MTPTEKAQRAAFALRRYANTRAQYLSQGSGFIATRDVQADALADLAELVLGLVATSEPEER